MSTAIQNPTVQAQAGPATESSSSVIMIPQRLNLPTDAKLAAPALEAARDCLTADIDINPIQDSEFDDHDKVVDQKSGVEELGYTYHGYSTDAKYMIPNGEIEQQRLNLQHRILKYAIGGKLTLAPIGDKVKNALDIGTGTGIWAIEFAREHPDVIVIGTDLSAIQPLDRPQNCQFKLGDMEEAYDWNWNGLKFDYIHGRALATCFKNHETVFKYAYENLVPGGVLELQDGMLPFQRLDGSMAGTAFHNLFEHLYEASERTGRPWTNVVYYQDYLERAGFVDIVTKHVQIPVGSWAQGEYHKAMGTAFCKELSENLLPLCTRVLSHGLGFTPSQIEDLVIPARRELLEGKVQIYAMWVFIYGRKPE